MDIKFCHTSYPPEISINAKDTAFERALESAQNTQMRNKSVGFILECSFRMYKSVHLHTNTKNKPTA